MLSKKAIEFDRVVYRKYVLFVCPVVNVWSSLPAECMNFSSITSFRLSLLSVYFSKF